MKKLLCGIGLVVAAASSLSASSFYINEILFNPGGGDAPNEYFEIRGAPGASLSGYYLLGVEGDSGTPNPGDIQNIFDLGTYTIGPGGYLVLAQRDHNFTFDPAANWATNSGTGTGWGNGASSSVNHTADGSATDIENTSVTFLLVNRGAGSVPSLSLDLDPANTGTLDGMPAGWSIEDSVGILDGGATDIAYGAINFAPSANGTAPNRVLSTNLAGFSFTPGYVGRRSLSTGSNPGDWISAEILSNATLPFLTFSPSNIVARLSDGTADPGTIALLAGQSLPDTMGMGARNVPEPGLFALGGLGLAAFYCLSRRRAR